MEAVRDIRRAWPGTATKIIAVTADAFEDTRDTCIANGFDGWCAPFCCAAGSACQPALSTAPRAQRGRGRAARGGPLRRPRRPLPLLAHPPALPHPPTFL